MHANLKLQVGQFLAYLVAFGLALFLPAGTLAWLAGWIFLALFFGFLLATNLWLFKHNPRIATGAHALGHIRSARLGQTAFSLAPSPLLWMVDFHLVRCGSLSLVASAGLASVRWGNSPVVLVLPLVSDISGKLVLINGRAYSGRSGANRGLHRSISHCPASDV